MPRVARNYLIWTQRESGTFKLQLTFVDLVHDVIEPILLSYTDLLAEREQVCRVNINPPNLAVWADRETLVTVFDNVIGNATKHGELGGEIDLSVLERGPVDEVGVWNSGRRISEDRLQTLFDLFTCGPGTGAGTSAGIGLYLVHKIVEAHRGSLGVESEPGTGANFIFTLSKRRTRVTQRES